MAVALLKQHIVNTCQRRLGDAALTTEGFLERWSTSIIKVSGQMPSYVKATCSYSYWSIAELYTDLQLVTHVKLYAKLFHCIC